LDGNYSKIEGLQEKIDKLSVCVRRIISRKLEKKGELLRG